MHLDSEYRNRWVEFTLEDKVEDSRFKNWREVEWEKVKKVTANVLGKKYEVDDTKEGFKGFLNFRWGGKEALGGGKYKEINIWTIGWLSDVAHLLDIDFFTGELLKEYTMSIEEVKSHIHPNIQNRFDETNLQSN